MSLVIYWIERATSLYIPHLRCQRYETGMVLFFHLSVRSSVIIL